MEDQEKGKIELEDKEISEIEEIFFNEDTNQWVKFTLDEEEDIYESTDE